MTMIPIELKILDPKIEPYLPHYATAGSAGLDLRAALETPLTLQPGETVMLSTGLAIYIKDPDYAGLVLPRSSMGHKRNLVLGNLVGLIDSDYQGELKISMWNRSLTEPAHIEPFERVAQLIIIPVKHAEFRIVSEFVETDRSTGGFGSTGRF